MLISKNGSQIKRVNFQSYLLMTFIYQRRVKCNFRKNNVIVTCLSNFYRCYFGKCSFELAHLVPFPYSGGSSTRYSGRLHDFSITIPRFYKDVYINSFFSSTARLEFFSYRMLSFDL